MSVSQKGSLRFWSLVALLLEEKEVEMIKGITFIGTIYVVGRNMGITNNVFRLKK